MDRKPYIKEGHIDKALGQLKELPEYKGLYENKSLELIRKLNRMK